MCNINANAHYHKQNNYKEIANANVQTRSLRSGQTKLTANVQ